MRVAMYYNNNDVRIEEKAIPRIMPGELLVRIEASGICGSDVMEWYRIHKAPLVLGHEVAGEIVDVGAGVENWKASDRVVVAHHVPCNTCYYCLRGHHTVCDTLRRTNFDPGGFAEFVRVPRINVDQGVFRIPDAMSYEVASFVEPVACVLRAQRMAGFRAGDSLLVLGSGISGLLHIHVARALGAGLIMATDVNEYRIEAARRFGANLALHSEAYSPERLREINEGRLADIVVVCTSATTAFEQALQSVERGGLVLLFAPTAQGVTLPLSVNDIFWKNDVTLTTSYGGAPADYQAALRLLATGRLSVEEMITHRLSLDKTGLGFRLVAEARECIKVIVQPQK